MKNQDASLFSILLVIGLLFVSYGEVFGQKEARLSAGVGLPEALNIGFKYRINQSQVGGSVGWWPGDEESFLFDYENAFSFTVDYYYHFGGISQFSDLRPWYFRTGLNCILVDWDHSIEPLVDTFFRIGRDLYFSDKGGISLDGGFLVNLYDSGNELLRILPSLSIGLFYRL